MSGLFTRLAQQYTRSARDNRVSAQQQPLFKTDSFDEQDQSNELDPATTPVETQSFKPLTPPNIRGEIKTPSEFEAQVNLEAGSETLTPHQPNLVNQSLAPNTVELVQAKSERAQTLNPPPSPLPRHERNDTRLASQTENLEKPPPQFNAIDSLESRTRKALTPEPSVKQSLTEQSVAKPTTPIMPSPHTEARVAKHTEPQFEEQRVEISGESETIVNVTIGRIEVRAESEISKPSSQKPKKPSRQSLMSLDDYQAKRQRGER